MVQGHSDKVNHLVSFHGRQKARLTPAHQDPASSAQRLL